MPSTPFGLAGAVVAARSLGYANVADLILDEQMPPPRIVRLFTSSASKAAGHDLALIVIAGSIARCRAEPEGWRADIERDIALKAIGADLGKITAAATTLVNKNWGDIERLAASIAAPRAA